MGRVLNSLIARKATTDRALPFVGIAVDHQDVEMVWDEGRNRLDFPFGHQADGLVAAMGADARSYRSPRGPLALFGALGHLFANGIPPIRSTRCFANERQVVATCDVRLATVAMTRASFGQSVLVGGSIAEITLRVSATDMMGAGLWHGAVATAIKASLPSV